MSTITLAAGTFYIGASYTDGFCASLVLLSIGHAISNFVFNTPSLKQESLDNFYNSLVFIDGQKTGSGILAKHEKFGPVIITVVHVAKNGADVHLADKKIPLGTQIEHHTGSNVMLFKPDEISSYADESLPIMRENAQLKIGEKVYFGGYPFGVKKAHFHTGSVSYIGRDGQFSIDGTAVPGMSGGPVAIERNGKLYVVGVINAETFKELDGFKKSFSEIDLQRDSKEIEDQHRTETLKDIETYREGLKKTKTRRTFPKRGFRIDPLTDQLREDFSLFDNIWDDLNKAGVISCEGYVNEQMLKKGSLGLRSKYQEFEACIRKALAPSDCSSSSMNFQAPYDTQDSNASLNTVVRSLVSSMSTGIVNAHLFLSET